MKTESPIGFARTGRLSREKASIGKGQGGLSREAPSSKADRYPSRRLTRAFDLAALRAALPGVLRLLLVVSVNKTDFDLCLPFCKPQVNVVLASFSFSLCCTSARHSQIRPLSSVLCSAISSNGVQADISSIFVYGQRNARLASCRKQHKQAHLLLTFCFRYSRTQWR